MASMPTSTSTRPPSAWMTILISPSYMHTEALRMISGGSPSFQGHLHLAGGLPGLDQIAAVHLIGQLQVPHALSLPVPCCRAGRRR